MKIKGITPPLPSVEIIPILREPENIILRAQPVLDMSEFEALCPEPQPPWLQKAGEGAQKDYNNAKYQKLMQEYSHKRLAYMIVKSLSATDGLEWETVKIGDPATWVNYESELKASGFTEVEVSRIVRGVMDANSLNEDKVTEARKSFLASQQVEEVK